MNNEEILKQIDELQKQRVSLREKDIDLSNQILKLNKQLEPEIVKTGYYTDGENLFCKVYKADEKDIYAHELDVKEYYITEEIYTYHDFTEFIKYHRCPREIYIRALDKVLNHFKN